MPNNRFFTSSTLESGASIEIDEKEFHHLLHVSRCKEGEEIELINGKGSLAFGVIDKISKKTATVVIKQVEFHEKRKHRLILAQAMPMINHLEMILEKTTELGVDEYYLFSSRKSSSLPSKEKLSRFEAIFISAIKQSGRLYLPTLKIYPSLTDIPHIHGNRLFGDIRNQTPYLSSIDPVDTILFIGPEGGFTNDEVLFLESDYLANGVKLSFNILRVETASIIGCGLLAICQDKPQV